MDGYRPAVEVANKGDAKEVGASNEPEGPNKRAPPEEGEAPMKEVPNEGEAPNEFTDKGEAVYRGEFPSCPLGSCRCGLPPDEETSASYPLD